jgi:cytochrome c-type biogenesis protein CcmE
MRSIRQIPPRGSRRPLLLLVVVALAGVSLLVISALQDTITYYRTPSEVAAHPALVGQHVRLGGRVVPGSVRHTGPLIRFALTDGRRDVTVVHQGDPPGTFREDQDAVVEGVPEADGVFHADRVIVKHSNEYRPAPDHSMARDSR